MSKQWDPVERRYRELPREEPSAELDAKVLAAARSAVVPRSFPRRWGAPLAAAAVLVLAVGVTLQVQRSEKKAEVATAPAARAVQSPVAAKAVPESAPEPIPFAPRRPLEPAPATALQENAASDAVRAKIAPAAPAPPAAGYLAAPARADLRLQKQQEEAARAAAGAAASGASGPFTLDQATTAGPQVRTFQPR